MALILKGTVRLYYYLNEDIIDHRTKDWFLIGSPWPGICILSLFLLGLFRYLKKFMDHRNPYDLRSTIAVFNLIQIAACVYIVYQSLALGWLNHYSFICQPVDHGPHSIDYAWTVCYGYFIIKFADLLDTVFFVLRKKYNQVTFLHVYHHIGMVCVAWAVVKWAPGGHITFFIPMNCAVHTVMYSYYLLTIWDERYKRSVWWKRHVTQIQIVQFFCILVHQVALVIARDCPFPKPPAYLLIPQNLFMMLLFLDFYYHTYIKSSKKN